MRGDLHADPLADADRERKREREAYGPDVYERIAEAQARTDEIYRAITAARDAAGVKPGEPLLGIFTNANVEGDVYCSQPECWQTVYSAGLCHDHLDAGSTTLAGLGLLLLLEAMGAGLLWLAGVPLGACVAVVLLATVFGALVLLCLPDDAAEIRRQMYRDMDRRIDR